MGLASCHNDQWQRRVSGLLNIGEEVIKGSKLYQKQVNCFDLLQREI
jgi:fatty acid/phospholipid biosynthesis enzyme